MKRVIALIILIALPVLVKAADNDTVYLSLEIFQTLDRNSALARTSNWDVVKIQTDNDIYYDGKKVAGTFVFIDTYRYTTNGGVTKTVPVYRLLDDSKSERLADKYLSVEVIQVLEEGAALAKTYDGDIVLIEDSNETLYDGKKISGKYYLLNTYSYLTKGGSYKTVPRFIKSSEQGKAGKEKPKDTTTYLSVEIFQTLSKNEALAKTSNWDIVKLETTEEVYYDGKKVSGTFILVGTYQYTTMGDDDKTVPVYIRASEYKKLMEE